MCYTPIHAPGVHCEVEICISKSLSVCKLATFMIAYIMQTMLLRQYYGKIILWVGAAKMRACAHVCVCMCAHVCVCVCVCV